jgi:hypothetical protein
MNKVEITDGRYYEDVVVSIHLKINSDQLIEIIKHIEKYLKSKEFDIVDKINILIENNHERKHL